ncbi:unnamed protein product [Periconia digitata]|uniref:Uncharacterized protein n=1 Tax=Periconia digitata TaxID=1303443 RepID=A0A9W4U3G5_9PLEO|nr:unnamed protein product [Periconia digitata]
MYCTYTANLRAAQQSTLIRGGKMRGYHTQSNFSVESRNILANLSISCICKHCLTTLINGKICRTETSETFANSVRN